MGTGSGIWLGGDSGRVLRAGVRRSGRSGGNRWEIAGTAGICEQGQRQASCPCSESAGPWSQQSGMCKEGVHETLQA